MNYKPLEFRIYSSVKFIWGIFISVQMRTLAVRKGTQCADEVFKDPRS